MKITVDFDITPEELRQFLGLPNVEKIQNELVKNAQKYLKDTSQAQYQDLVTSAMKPMMTYQNWVQRMMMGEIPENESSTKTGSSTKQGKEIDE